MKQAMNVFKRIMAVLALISMAVFVVSVLAQVAFDELKGQPALSMIPMSCFLMFGLLSLATNWLMKLREKKIKEWEAAQKARTEE